jgi:hypothetical protein
MFKEFEEICFQERKSVTQKLNELITKTVENNGIVGGEEINSLNLPYGNGGNGKYQQQQQQRSQCDIRLWIPYNEALVMARRMVAGNRLNADDCAHLAKTFQTIERKIRTGYLDRN